MRGLARRGRRDVQLGQWDNLIFAMLNLVLASYAMVAYVGLGNTIVDLLTRAMDGSLRLKSAPGEGFTAVVTLPEATARTSMARARP